MHDADTVAFPSFSRPDRKNPRNRRSGIGRIPLFSCFPLLLSPFFPFWCLLKLSAYRETISPRRSVIVFVRGDFIAFFFFVCWEFVNCDAFLVRPLPLSDSYAFFNRDCRKGNFNLCLFALMNFEFVLCVTYVL